MGKDIQRSSYPFTFDDFCHVCYSDTDHEQWVVRNLNWVMSSKYSRMTDDLLPSGEALSNCIAAGTVLNS
jgi:hypothetical protein